MSFFYRKWSAIKYWFCATEINDSCFTIRLKLVLFVWTWIKLIIKNELGHPHKQLHSNTLATTQTTLESWHLFFKNKTNILFFKDRCSFICYLLTDHKIWLIGNITCFLRWERRERMKREKKKKRKESWRLGPTGSAWTSLKRYLSTKCIYHWTLELIKLREWSQIS